MARKPTRLAALFVIEQPPPKTPILLVNVAAAFTVEEDEDLLCSRFGARLTCRVLPECSRICSRRYVVTATNPAGSGHAAAAVPPAWPPGHGFLR